MKIQYNRSYTDHMSILLDRWNPPQLFFLKKRFLEATQNQKELDKIGFFSLFTTLQELPKAVSESAFRMFDTDGSGKLNFREFCCALALCCQLLSTAEDNIRG